MNDKKRLQDYTTEQLTAELERRFIARGHTEKQARVYVGLLSRGCPIDLATDLVETCPLRELTINWQPLNQ